MASWLPDLLELVRQVGVPLLAAFVLGGAIGWEREWRHKPAGLRTHMLVALGAAAATVVTLELYHELVREGEAGPRADPLRIVEGVIGGIGFLGAGAILREGGSVRGLTTAGTVWLAGAVGLACGSGRYAVAVGATFLGLLALTVLRVVEQRFEGDGRDAGDGGSHGEEGNGS